MALRFLADHCISNFFIRKLQEANCEVFRVRDLMPPDSPDTAVIAKAQEINAPLLSLNGDFANIVTYPPKSYRGIVALQIRNHPEVIPDLMVRLNDYLEQHPAPEHYAGRLLIVDVNRIRIRE